jgi:hypothetical protein
MLPGGDEDDRGDDYNDHNSRLYNVSEVVVKLMYWTRL